MDTINNKASKNIARVTAEYKEAYRIRNTNNEYLAKITGKQIFNATERQDYPAVGDWVYFTILDKERAIINGILPRKTILKKKYSNKYENQVIASNLDTAFIIESADRDYNLNRFERYLILVREGNIEPVFVLNKIDLISETERDLKITQIKNRFRDICIIITSTIIDNGLKELEGQIMADKTYCFLGSSGVGKSSLINGLLGKEALKTNVISWSTGKGKHTTTNRQMYFLKNGGIVVDNPGMREIGMTDSNIGILNVYDDISILSQMCKFRRCTHIHEPGCAVLSAIKSGDLDKDKYANFIKLKKEVDYYAMTKSERKSKDKKFGKFIKKTLEQLEKAKYK